MSRYASPAMIIPHSALSADVLRLLVEEFITREGAEHGHEDVPLERKVGQVLDQLKRGEAQISYDEESETCTIVPAGGSERG